MAMQISYSNTINVCCMFTEILEIFDIRKQYYAKSRNI